MDTGQLGVFWLIISSVTLFAMIFGIRYLSNKENMALIEKGIDPKLRAERRPAPFRNLKTGLLLVGAGLGLFLAYFLDNFVLYNVRHAMANEYNEGANVPIYFALIAIGGGIGLILSYRIERKNLGNNPN